jgi:hypothetical protein
LPQKLQQKWNSGVMVIFMAWLCRSGNALHYNARYSIYGAASQHSNQGLEAFEGEGKCNSLRLSSDCYLWRFFPTARTRMFCRTASWLAFWQGLRPDGKPLR